MKVKIINRSVYHKVAEVEVEVPDNIKKEEVLDYLNEYSQMYEYEMDEAINEAKYEFGFGLDNDEGLDEKDEESEWRYEIVGQNYGGHL
tara:strand:- start:770 stop:1036 length:267 start_codon:yes stop_codon:yes gene_type:complete